MIKSPIDILFLALISFLFAQCHSERAGDLIKSSQQSMEDKLYPFEGHIMDKNYPETSFALKAYRNALAQVKKEMDSQSFRNGQWVNQGPGNIGGRINTIAINPNDPSEMMLGYSFGGIFKTGDDGNSWNPVFDGEDIQSISDIKYDPNNDEIVYVGTGDLNISGYAVTGNGAFKSVNGGESWQRIGLQEAGVICEIGISKSNSATLYAASMGVPFERNSDRGLYKSTNSGQDWEQVFYLNDSTGVIDIEVHPDDENIVYAATWTRIRNNRESLIESEETGIYKTIDGGETWVKLDNGLPGGKLIRPGLAMYEGNPDVLYAMFVHDNLDTLCSPGYHLQGIYKSSDAGENWSPIPTGEETGLPCAVLGGFGWYFGQVRVAPTDENTIFILGVDLYDTRDGGVTWNRSAPPWFSYSVHADKHDLEFVGSDVILATDGGAYRNNSLTGEWEDIENIVSTQFYRIAVSPHLPGNYFGGAQDNGSTGGNIDSINNWPRIFGGDGFQMAFHPTNPDIFYVETQNGNIRITQNGGQSFQGGTTGLSGSRNWDMPYMISSQDPSMLYTGTDRMFRSISLERPDWVQISGLLTDTLDPSSAFSHTISTLDESTVNPDILYCGTSDGFVWRSVDFGFTWEQINDGLPRRYISDIKASVSDASTVYVTIQGYKDNDFTPYIYKSTDNGSTWNSINGNLPQIAINDILLPKDDEDDTTIFVGTDGGVYYTDNAGLSWERVGDNMPIFPIYDLAINGQNELVAGSFARGIYTFNLSQLESTATEDINSISTFKVYPTVTQDIIYIETKDGSRFEGEIITQSGQLVKRINMDSGSSINVHDLPSGLYMVRSKLNRKVERFVKN